MWKSIIKFRHPNMMKSIHLFNYELQLHVYLLQLSICTPPPSWTPSITSSSQTLNTTINQPTCLFLTQNKLWPLFLDELIWTIFCGNKSVALVSTQIRIFQSYCVWLINWFCPIKKPMIDLQNILCIDSTCCSACAVN